MKILEVEQGSDQWLKLRESHFCASDAPAMMGASKYKSRDELLREKATGVVPEVDAHKQALFDRGHAAEASARKIVEQELTEDLYPAVIEDGDLLASLDGITMDHQTIYEHKLFNQVLADQVENYDLAPMYYFQLEHQLLVSGAKTVIFIVSDGTKEQWVEMEYIPVPGRAEELTAGWAQFKIDLEAYEPVVVEEAPKGQVIQTLPALTVEVIGNVVSSNLIMYEERAVDFVMAINTDLETDQDFADAKNMVKFCEKVEDELKLVKSQSLAQMLTVDEVFSTIDRVQEEFRQKRLKLDKLVKNRELSIRIEIIDEAKQALFDHVDTVNEDYRNQIMDRLAPDFNGAIKGKRTVTTVREAANDELARCKIEVNRLGETVSFNLDLIQNLATQHRFLFPDITSLLLKDPEDFAILAKSRIDTHDQAEKDKAAAADTERKDKIRDRISAIDRAASAAVSADIEGAERILRRLEDSDPATFEGFSKTATESIALAIAAVTKVIEDKKIEAERLATAKPAEETEPEVASVEQEPLAFGTIADKESLKFRSLPDEEHDFYCAGDDYREDGAENMTYGIHADQWGNKIVVYGDRELRDKIVDLLNADHE